MFLKNKILTLKLSFSDTLEKEKSRAEGLGKFLYINQGYLSNKVLLKNNSDYF